MPGAGSLYKFALGTSAGVLNATRIIPFRLVAPTRTRGVDGDSPEAFFGHGKVQVVSMVVKGRQLRRLLDGGGKRVSEGKGRYVAYLNGRYVADTALQRLLARTGAETGAHLGEQLWHARQKRTSVHQHVSTRRS
jgi:hypothetical protein